MIDRRAKFRAQCSTIYLPFYDKLCAALGPEWHPYSGARSFSDQDNLYAMGRTKGMLGKGFIVTNARGGESAHNYACASDWTIFENGQPIWMKKEDPRWEDLIKAVRASGLRSGADWGDVDHNEVWIDCDWKHVLLVLQAGNLTQAMQKIEASLHREV